ncbi:intermembrane space AAA protease IAP-1 [Lepidopterella palustris CBS 459.81]|uniref:Intermembrane space AAA protease IAP-1 n=1 Tax=Lepidopterella palustris CBS 459.81 TaxID=1314670 RepID=A0A8E2JHB1_9PEZI|nr:intermembrane space AAA protease IAP-1 [Lepidopterella palustris CBS 459.81]
MAFQAPVSVQGIVTATSELWPSMSVILQSPWRLAGRQIPLPASGKQSRQVVKEPVHDIAKPSQATVLSTLALPECLESVPMSALTMRPSAEALKAQPTVSGIISSVSPNALRLYNPLARTLPPKAKMFRQYSTLSRLGPWGSLRPVPRPGNLGLGLIQQRTLFGATSSRNLLAHMELTANNNPQSATAQNAFYSALLRANMPEIIVERYQTGRFATNPACEAMYIRALERVGQTEKVAAIQSAKDGNGQSGNLTTEQMQAIGQAVGARVRGGNLSVARSGSGGKESPLYVVVEESTGSTVFKWFRFVLWFGLITYLSLIVVTLFIEASGMLKKVGGTQNTEARPELQTTRFSDVHGCDEAKEELQELVDFLKNPEKFSTLGGKLPKGVLLVGPPGTGKTLLARAVAGEAGVPFFYMSGSEFDEVYVGVGAKRVRELFNAARAKAPAIVFIDELDAIGGKRNERDAAYVKQTLNQLLTDLDGFDQNSGVIFLAATNFPQLLDKALTRPGRFDRNIVVPLPDVRGRVEILKYHMRNIQLSTDVDAALIARGTPGFSGAELENIVNQAAVHASKNKAKKVTMLDFEWAKDKVLMGAERRSAVIQEKDKIMTAYHEGGHALVAMYTQGSDPLYKATIMPRGHALGITFQLPEMDKVSVAKREYLAQIDVCMGGKAAEELIYGVDYTTGGASSDIQTATSIAYMMVTQMGMSEALGNVDLHSDYARLSSETKQLIEKEVRNIIEDGRKRAKALLISKRDELELLAKALVEYESLGKEEMEKVVRGEKLPDRLHSMPGVPIKLPEMLLPSTISRPGGDGEGDPGAGVPEQEGPGVYTGSG